MCLYIHQQWGFLCINISMLSHLRVNVLSNSRLPTGARTCSQFTDYLWYISITRPNPPSHDNYMIDVVLWFVLHLDAYERAMQAVYVKMTCCPRRFCQFELNNLFNHSFIFVCIFWVLWALIDRSKWWIWTWAGSIIYMGCAWLLTTLPNQDPWTTNLFY